MVGCSFIVADSDYSFIVADSAAVDSLRSLSSMSHIWCDRSA
jgi:hypothetical protein